NALRAYYAAHQGAYPADTMRMMFTSNHDKNAWEGTQFEAFGDALPAAIALSVASEGIPLIYNGQEAGNNRRLKFFEKDPIRWQSHELASLFRRLFALKKANRALWNAGWGAPMVQVVNSEPQSIFSFTRTKGDHRLLAMFNFSDQKRSFTLTDGPFANDWQDFASGQLLTLTGSSTVDLPAWGYQILVQPQTTSSP
ncbi:MAG: alpha-glucosidase C-terminal domain-containing protein, partial [Pseudomonadota bacterium]